ncbi:MAG: Lrp/AsnC family transcriptional regulator [Candidatus Nezhaarchaeota archaeon]|nr:Lrp/AsnC family transcriptional regulator [Candidatus Nezhaarchaeota archaeon]MCX8142411.1 Lrp/AsnC family transcriptional regulator [Candidatus Nezhaarchaeota archaeon]MDW8050616.1 Lrp/AsnC family transcriptional regulator [Nitrososphaerota archaeon]
MGSVEVDDIDLKIMEILKSNGRASYKEIAEKVGLGIATVYKRIKRLEGLGIIKGYTTIIDESKLGKSIVGYVGIEVRPADTNKVLEELLKMDEVVEIATVTGTFDILVKVRVKSLNELWNFIYVKTPKIKEILKTTTMIAVDLVKDELRGQGLIRSTTSMV